MPEPMTSATEGLVFDDEELESRLVWIFGSPRSGSTWLLEMLCHPLRPDPRSDVGFRWPEGWSGEPAALPVDEFRIASHLVAASGVAELDNGAVVPDSLNFFFAAYSSYAFSSAFEDVWRPEARRFTLVRLNAVIDRAKEAGLGLDSGVPLLVIKEVNSSHGADLVMSLFPRSRMIFLVRDGRDVLDSLLDANQPGGWLARDAAPEVESEHGRREFVRRNALDWVARMNVCTRAYDDHDPALRRRVRYEDLVADGDAQFGALAGWLALPAGPRRIRNVVQSHSMSAVPDDRKGTGKIRRAASPGRWREGLSEEEQDLAREIMATRLRELGYEQ